MRLSTFLTDSLSRTLSEVTGQIPPLAKVAAITDLQHFNLIQVELFFTIIGSHALCSHLERAELKVEVKDCLDVHKALGRVGHPEFEEEEISPINGNLLTVGSIYSPS